MTSKRTSIHGQWSSRMAFILAATGSAVGLGNIWRFPYLLGVSGGSAFVLIYLICTLLLGIPIMMAEILVGRRGRQNPVNTMSTLAREEGLGNGWRWLGMMGILAGFLIISYYSVIAGWVLAYIFRSGTGMFQQATPDQISSMFTDLVADPERMLAWHTIFMVMCAVVISGGVKNGLEKAVKFMMPALFALLLLMVGYAMSTDKFMYAMDYLFVPDWDKLTSNFTEIFINASGHAFFSLSLGMGAIMIYGSYLSDRTSIASAAVVIAMADSLVAILASMAIFPIVFSYGLEPSSGPGLIFITLPIAFSQMPYGLLFGTLFFILVIFAAWTSGISLLEPAVTWMVENRNMSRRKATVMTAIVAWFLGIATVFSFNHWAFEFKFAGISKTNGLFDMIDILTANVMLPLGGFMIAVFVAWRMSRNSSMDELKASINIYNLWRFVLRYIAPLGILMIFLFYRP